MNLFQRAVSIDQLSEHRVAQQELKVQQADVTFREEVIEELVTVFGFARHVAAEQTDTHAKLMAKAKEIDFI